MERTLVATYERKSTLWKNANVFYVHQDWTKMECIVYDYSREIEEIRTGEVVYYDMKHNDVSEQELERRYGKPYCINLVNNRETNSKSWFFQTKQEANEFFKEVMNNKSLRGWKKVQ